MSNTDCGKKNKTSRKKDVISYFQNPQSNNPHPIHASSSLEQGIAERDVNTFENSSATQKMDGKIHSSNDQSARQMHFHPKLVVQMLKIFHYKVTQCIHRKGKRANGT